VTSMNPSGSIPLTRPAQGPRSPGLRSSPRTTFLEKPRLAAPEARGRQTEPRRAEILEARQSGSLRAAYSDLPCLVILTTQGKYLEGDGEHAVMESTPLSADAQRIADGILLVVDARGEAAFAALDQAAPGFRVRPRRTGRDLACIRSVSAVIMWSGVSAGGVEALAYLFENLLARPVFVRRVVYQQCSDVPKLPLLGTAPLNETAVGARRVLKRGPFPEMMAEQELRALDVFAEATLAGRGAAPLH
jgi:hypothetical protein